MRIIVDTREQKPLKFACATVSEALDCGDYALVGKRNLARVEYKSLGDWHNWIRSTAPARFNSQVARLRKVKYPVIVVGGRFFQRLPRHYGVSVADSVHLRKVSTLVRLRIPVLFANNRREASLWIQDFLGGLNG